MIWYLYVLQNSYNNSSYYPSPYMQYIFLMMRTFKIYSLNNFQICNTVLLTLVAILYITSPWLIYHISGNLYLLTPFTHPTHPLPLWQPPVWSLCLWACFVCILKIPHIGEIIHYLFLLFVWLISFSLMPSKSIHIVANGEISFFFMAEE